MDARIRNVARALRRRMPETERLMWSLLRDHRLDGLKFRRQVPIGPYIVDFACMRRRLVVEADGPFHDETEDAVRDRWLREQGFKVMRIPNSDVRDRLVIAILEALGD